MSGFLSTIEVALVKSEVVRSNEGREVQQINRFDDRRLWDFPKKTDLHTPPADSTKSESATKIEFIPG